MNQPIDIRFDPRFDMEKNWSFVELSINEGQSRGLEITPLTVFGPDGSIYGWELRGWTPRHILTITGEDSNGEKSNS